VLDLKTLSGTQQYSAEWLYGKGMLNWRERGKKRSWPDLKHYPIIRIDGPMQTKISHMKHRWSPGRDSNLAPQKCKLETLPFEPT
jgi:hypothetical protein